MKQAGQRQDETVIFIGTEKIVGLLGSLDGGEPRLIRSASLETCEGFEKGFVKSLDRAGQAIEAIVKELYAGQAIQDPQVWVVLGNSKLKTWSFSSSLYFQGFHRTITSQEVRSVIRQTRSVATLPLSEFVLATAPESFVVDDLQGVASPLGLEARRLGVMLKIFSMNFEDFKNLSRAFELAEVQVKGYFPQTLTTSVAVLNEQEKEEGALLFDFTEEAVFISVWKGGILKDTRILEPGSAQLAAEVGGKWDFDVAEARKVVRKYASLETQTNFKDELIPLSERGGKAFSVHRQEFQTNFLDFAKRWLSHVLAEGDACAESYQIRRPHYVFSGECALWSGFLELLQSHFSKTGRIGIARRIQLPAELATNASVPAAAGALRWLADTQDGQRRLVEPRGFLEKTLVSAKDWFAAYF